VRNPKSKTQTGFDVVASRSDVRAKAMLRSQAESDVFAAKLVEHRRRVAEWSAALLSARRVKATNRDTRRAKARAVGQIKDALVGIRAAIGDLEARIRSARGEATPADVERLAMLLAMSRRGDYRRAKR
jgi:hypothetical protein